MSDQPRPSRRRPRKRPQPKSRRTAKLAFFLIFLALFGTVDLIILSYEMAARGEFEKSRDHIENQNNAQAYQTWMRALDEYPYSYVACEIRRRLDRLPEAELAKLTRGPENYGQIGLRMLSRRAIAPGLEKLAGAGWASEPLRRVAARARGSAFGPRRTPYTPVIAGLVAWLLALYLLLGFWRTFKLRLRWRLFWLALTSLFVGLVYLRAVGAPPRWLEQLSTKSFYLEVEFLVGLTVLLASFCLLFIGRPRREEREPAVS